MSQKAKISKTAVKELKPLALQVTERNLLIPCFNSFSFHCKFWLFVILKKNK